MKPGERGNCARGDNTEIILEVLALRWPEPRECRNESAKQALVDDLHYRLIRMDVTRFLESCCSAADADGLQVLEVAPQEHGGVSSIFRRATVDTIDIDPSAATTFCGDITRYNEELRDCSYDMVVCAEVLEHTLNPFAAVKEVERVLKPGGILLVTVPLDFRIHGPLPDCWRFTVQGIRELLCDFEIQELLELPSWRRPLMPLHYSVKARKPG